MRIWYFYSDCIFEKGEGNPDISGKTSESIDWYDKYLQTYDAASLDELPEAAPHGVKALVLYFKANHIYSCDLLERRAVQVRRGFPLSKEL